MERLKNNNMTTEKLNPLKTIKELMEKHKGDNPLLTLRCCVHECGTNANHYVFNYTPETEHLGRFWIDLYYFFADLTDTFGVKVDEFRFWIDYDEDIEYSYIKDYDYGKDLQVRSKSCDLLIRVNPKQNTFEEAIEMMKKSTGRNE